MSARMSQGCWYNSEKGVLTRVVEHIEDLGKRKLSKEGRPDDGAGQNHVEECGVF